MSWNFLDDGFVCLFPFRLEIILNTDANATCELVVRMNCLTTNTTKNSLTSFSAFIEKYIMGPSTILAVIAVHQRNMNQL